MKAIEANADDATFSGIETKTTSADDSYASMDNYTIYHGHDDIFSLDDYNLSYSMNKYQI